MMYNVEVIKETYCQSCRKTLSQVENLMVISSKGFHRYYMCRQCNTKRSQAYRKTKKGKLSTRLAVKKSIEKFYYKQSARLKLNEAVKRGLVLKPKQCECGEKKVEAHHSDYSQPLSVQWLCRGCHANIHRLLRIERLVEVD